MKRVSVGVVGVGAWGRNVARVIASSRFLKLAAVCDVNEEAAKSAAATFRSRWYTKVEEMLEREALDAVAIAVPAEKLAGVAAICIEFGVPSFVEKPVALSSEAVAELMRAAKAKGVPVVPGFIMRFNPVVLELRRVLEKHYRDVEIVVFRRLSRRPKWRRRIPILYDLSIHDVDLASFLLAPELTVKSATVMTTRTDDVVFAVLSDAEGRIIVIHTDGVSLAKVREIDLEGANIFVRADTEELKLFVKDEQGVRTVKVPYVEPLMLELEEFGRLVASGNSLSPSLEDAFRALRIIEHIAEKARVKASEDAPMAHSGAPQSREAKFG